MDAPVKQAAKINTDFKIKCVVTANPQANVDWLREATIIVPGICLQLLFCTYCVMFLESLKVTILF